MITFEYDLHYLKAGLNLLENYLLSDEIFWPMDIHPSEGQHAYPSLTLDGLLLAQARLVGHRLYPIFRDQVDPIISDLEFYRSKWRVAWEKKASQCYSVRARMWHGFLQEYRDNPQENDDRYRYEVRLRVMLELLKPESKLGDHPEEELLSGLDKYLKSVITPKGFIWDADIQGAFPEDVYWYLYGILTH
jgi:hypothetical protein